MDQIVNIENVRNKFANNMNDDIREASIAVRTIILDKTKVNQEEQFFRIDTRRKKLRRFINELYENCFKRRNGNPQSD